MDHRIVLVTGSTQGIGLATALAFYHSGAKVVFTGRSVKKLKEAQKQIKDPSRAMFEQIDFTDPSSCRKLVQKIVKKWKRIDVLINNCGGIEKKGQFLDLDESDWLAAFELNFMTAVRMSKLVIPIMQANGGGRIVNISSFTALQPGSFNPHYSSAKMALIHLTKHLSAQLAKDKIFINTVSPGHIQTEGWDGYIKEKALNEKKEISAVREKENKRVINRVPLGRFGQPEEVAEIIQYICSDAGKFITGSNFVIDGGVISGI